MLEIISIGLGIIALIVLNTMYVAWRGRQQRRAEAERNNPLSSR